MDWADVCAGKTLQDLAYKIELDQWGRIVMSPASNRHGRIRGRVLARILELADSGDAVVECSVATSGGVKVADVAWGSDAFFAEHGEATPYPVAPDVCVEIVSPSNIDTEMLQKVEPYLAKGAREVWRVGEDGEVEIYTYGGVIAASRLFPTFPKRIEP